MGSWDRFTAFEFNDKIQERGGIWSETIPWNSKPGRSLSRDDYKPPSPVVMPQDDFMSPSPAVILQDDHKPPSPAVMASPTVPSFQRATSAWSPPTSPDASPDGTLWQTPPRIFRSDSARAVNTCAVAPMSAREKNKLADGLYAAACVGDLDHIKLLLSVGAPINAGTVVQGLYDAFKPAKSGRLSALAGAATHGQREVVDFLLAHGADLNPDINQSSSAPLEQAVRMNDIELARYFLEIGADVNRCNCYKSSPLMYAVKYGSQDMVRLVLAFKPDLRQESFIGAAAIHWAVWPNKIKILELLLRAGSKVDQPMADGNTALHCSVASGYAPMVKCLLRYGADPLRKNEEYKTPLQIAEKHGHPEIAEIIQVAARRRGTYP